jgi:ech hydrogenase subunit E
LTDCFPLGPYHPALPEPVLFRLYGDGEIIERAEVRLGFGHRGIEGLLADRDLADVPAVLARLCGGCSQAHLLAFRQAVEKAAGFEPDERTRYLRVVAVELERVCAHLYWLGQAAINAGQRRQGLRLTRQAGDVAGVLRDLAGDGLGLILPGESPAPGREALSPLFDRSRLAASAALSTLDRDPLYRSRISGTGLISRADALELGLAGVVARASGLDRDARRADRDDAYGRLVLRVVSEGGGDVRSRLRVRATEVLESLRLVDQALVVAHESPVEPLADFVPLSGEVVATVEAAPGELSHYLTVGEQGRVDRLRIATASFANLAALPLALQGQRLGDVPLIFASFGLCLACADR